MVHETGILSLNHFHIPKPVARQRGVGATATRRGTLAPPSEKIEQFVGERHTGGNFKNSCLFSQTGKRKNELSALNVNNKTGVEFLQGNRGE